MSPITLARETNKSAVTYITLEVVVGVGGRMTRGAIPPRGPHPRSRRGIITAGMARGGICAWTR
jgi:hypothetical protein